MVKRYTGTARDDLALSSNIFSVCSLGFFPTPAPGITWHPCMHLCMHMCFGVEGLFFCPVILGWFWWSLFKNYWNGLSAGTSLLDKLETIYQKGSSVNNHTLKRQIKVYIIRWSILRPQTWGFVNPQEECHVLLSNWPLRLGPRWTNTKQNVAYLPRIDK